GEIFLNRVKVTTNGAGSVNFDITLPQSFAFSSPTYSVDEDGGSALITVTRTLLSANGDSITATATDPNQNTSELSNCLATSGDSSASVDFATSDGTATANVDYRPTSGTLTFDSGKTTQSFTVEVFSNSAQERNQTVNLALSNPTGGASLGDPHAAVLTIVNQGGGGGGGCSLTPEKMGSAVR
ncbi:MAG TPA: Calx-beta domain-containing protein, partial [bacterium]|nr:Calx-beta domain-containing protein [bacterium]